MPPSQVPDHAAQPVKTITATALAQALETADAPVLLDVREGWEFAQGALPSALHLPVAQITQATSDALGLGPQRPIVTYCHHGVRSHRAAQALQAAGYTDVRSLTGGIDAWAQDVDPQVGRY